MPWALMPLLCVLAPIGQRPYEMVWANRTEDDHPALVDFEAVDGWQVDASDSIATLEASQEQLLWGDHVAKLTYRADGGSPRVTVRPPAPIECPGPFDAVNFWVYGNNWAFAPDSSTPPVSITVVFRGGAGEVPVLLGGVGWMEWWVMHTRLRPDQVQTLGDHPALLRIEFGGGTNRQDRVLFLDNLSVYTEQLAPLTFEPRPARNLTPFPGQTTGTNTGPGKLPFPTREETILPELLTPGKSTVEKVGAGYEFRFASEAPPLTYRYEPKSGTLSDVTLSCGDAALTPMAGGGVLFSGPAEGQEVAPDRAELLACEDQGGVVRARWRLHQGERQAEVEYAFRLWGRSLVVDVICLGGDIGRVAWGRATGVEGLNPRLVTLPYLTYGGSRPAVLVLGAPDRPLFLTGFPDWYRSNASELFATNEVNQDGAAFNGGCIYRPRTDGRRNDCFERLFLTVSPQFEEILPTIANPKSPWMAAAGERVWIAYGASSRAADLATWTRAQRYGMTGILITDHETGWRDGGESFTLRTRAAPGKGGDEGQAAYARDIQALGFRYGIYNNYTDFSPVNEFWSEDWVARQPDGELRRAWPRCYNLKPSRAVEIESRLAPIIQDKFHLSTAYCDVHTAVQPWVYCDYDARVPGAGTFAATYYAYGEIMLHQKATWNGPVYSEGNSHWTYCGLTDGNYAQDQGGKLATSPWLVDFDLRKMHPLGCNFGMGSPEMFYGYGQSLGRTQAEREARLDRFLAATVAFGHTGFFARDAGQAGEARAYFMLQQLHKHYAEETAERIEYADAAGNLVDTSAAVASDAFRRSQVRTTYSNGLVTLANGNTEADWACTIPEAVAKHAGLRGDSLTLPPNGYGGYWAEGDTVRVAVLSAVVNGRRVDYADTPAYVFIDGRREFTRLAKAAADGPVAALQRPDGKVEAIPFEGCRQFAVSLDGREAEAVALDFDRKELGLAKTTLCRGLVSVEPVEGAVSYLLTPTRAPAVALTCDADSVVPGETVTIRGNAEHRYDVPRDAKPGTRLIVELEGATIDFLVRPLADVSASLAGTPPEQLAVQVRSNLRQATDGVVRLAGDAKRVRLEPGAAAEVTFDLGPAAEESVRELAVEVEAAGGTQTDTWWLKAERELVPLELTREPMDTGEFHRGGAEGPLSATSGTQVTAQRMPCGGVEHEGLFMHPPWMNASGYTFALLPPLALPADTPMAFRCLVGKRDGSDPGDGILFIVSAVDEKGQATELARHVVTQHAWEPLEADLSAYAGQTVRLKLVAHPGDAFDCIGDWACYGELGVSSLEPVLHRTLHTTPVVLRYEPGPTPVAGLSEADLRAARAGWAHYQAIGLDTVPPFINDLLVNGKRIGQMVSGPSDETIGRWSDDLRLAITPEAIASLGAVNQLAIENRGGDNFKVRRFWIELELADGQKCSSRVSTTTYTQPPTWLYAEGELVPQGDQIRVEVRFDLAE